jgi:hypothetical protein
MVGGWIGSKSLVSVLLQFMVVPPECYKLLMSCVHNLIKQGYPSTRHGGAWGKRMYSSYSLLTSALDGGEWSVSRPGCALPPGKGPSVPIG